jgi:hypothetical protein
MKNINKINIGCGTNVVVGDGWLNIDNSLVAKNLESSLLGLL